MYPSDINDEEWERVRTILKEYYPPYEEHRESKVRRGRRMRTDMRDIIDALFYISKTGCQWKFMPLDFPPWGTVRHHFERFQELEIWDKLLEGTNRKIRQKEGRNENPTLGIVDRKSVKTLYGGEARGYDGNKQVKGRKRNLIVDVLGLTLGIYVSSAQPHDTKLAPTLIEKTLMTYPSLQVFAFDKGYRGTTAKYVEHLEKKYIIPERQEGQKVSPKRWIVERSLSWFGQDRRLSKDYEVLPKNSETFIKISSLRRNIKK